MSTPNLPGQDMPFTVKDYVDDLAARVASVTQEAAQWKAAALHARSELTQTQQQLAEVQQALTNCEGKLSDATSEAPSGLADPNGTAPGDDPHAHANTMGG